MKKESIKAALDKLEKESATLGQENNKIRKQEASKVKTEVRTETEKRIREAAEQKSFQKSEFKRTVAFYGGLFILSILVVTSMTREARTTLIEYIVYFILSAGIVASRMKR